MPERRGLVELAGQVKYEDAKCLGKHRLRGASICRMIHGGRACLVRVLARGPRS